MPELLGLANMRDVEREESSSMGNVPVLALVPPGPLRDRLNNQVIRGRKTATSRLPVMDEMQGTPVEAAGSRMRLLDSANLPVAILEITGSAIVPFDKVSTAISSAEGDSMADPEEWRRAHWRFWSSHVTSIQAYLGDPTWNLTPDMEVVVRFFRLIERLTEASTAE